MRGSAFTVLLILSCSAIARVAEDRIDYSFTVDDPTYYTQPWQGESHFLRRGEPMLEYACHEANYSLVHILEGARERDRQEVR